ncbi:MAG: hypothetical protein HY904_24725 [Deltaproteobacteria bacterium]|nr:hypothetical protein [Deltaproteobacteria bacterium]
MDATRSSFRQALAPVVTGATALVLTQVALDATGLPLTGTRAALQAFPAVLLALHMGAGLRAAAPLTWLAAVVSIPVAGRLVLVGSSWSLAPEAALAAGALVGLYVLAGVRASAPEPLRPAGAWGDVLEQARTAHRALLDDIRQNRISGPAVETLRHKSATLLTSMERTAQGWAGIGRTGSEALEHRIESQLAGVRTERERADDELARGEYARTEAALVAQAEAVRRIRAQGERALARVRSQVALLETARLSVMAYAAQERSVQQDEAARLAEMLETASQELDVTAGAMAEASEVPRLTA